MRADRTHRFIDIIISIYDFMAAYIYQGFLAAFWPSEQQLQNIFLQIYVLVTKIHLS